MCKPLLSIVVPTKNRYIYLYSLIEQIASFNDERIELVIQDNSENNQEILDFLNLHKYSFISYYWEKNALTMTENSDLAVSHANGDFVCFLGDDEVVSKYLIELVNKMNKKNIEAAIFNKGRYDWPGVQRLFIKYTSLMIPNFTCKCEYLNSADEFVSLMKRGGVTMGKLPSLYQGVVKKTVLDAIKNDLGTYFPSACPDMAVGVTLVFYLQKYINVNIPLITSGASPKSAAGLGAKHQHKGKLSEMSFLPKDIEENWEKRIPKIWTGETIYADAIFSALKKMKKEEELKKFNYEYFYATFKMYEREYKSLLNSPDIKGNYNIIKTNLYFIGIFIQRIFWFIYNRTLRPLGISGVKYINNIQNSFEAMKAVDIEIDKKTKGNIEI